MNGGTDRRAPAPAPRAALREAPRSALLLGAGMAIVALVVVIAAAARSPAALAALEARAAAEAGSPKGSSAPVRKEIPASDRAPADELEAARRGGTASLEALAARFPKDPAVLKALMVAQMVKGAGHAGPLATARRLLEVSPDAADDDDVRTLVMTAAGSPSSEASSQAFDLMAKRMGSRGPDLLYELSSASPALKDRALRALAEPGLMDRATPALRVAYELRAASSCDARKKLLDRAAEVGDKRAADVLGPLIVAKGRGCGFLGMSRCPAPCAAISADIKKALQAIEARVPGATSSARP